MKSFSEWKNQDIYQTISEISVAGIRNWFGGSSMKVDPQIRAQIKSKLINVWRDAQAAGMSRLDFARQVMAAAYGVSTGKSGTNISAAQAATGLQQAQTGLQQAQPAAVGASDQVAKEWAKFVDELLVEMSDEGASGDEIDNTSLIRMLGGSSIKINHDLRADLHPKLQQILRDPKIDEMRKTDPSELLRQFVAIAANEIVGRPQSGSMNTSYVAGKLDDPIAREAP